MKRVVAAIIAAAIVLSCAGAGVTVWLLTRNAGPYFPQISAYTHGELTRVGPYSFCAVANPTDCINPQTQGELRVVPDEPVQLSLDEQIGGSVWGLRLYYEDPRFDKDTEIMRPGTVAATIPSTDPERGRLTGITVQLPIVVMTPEGQEFRVRAEWSVRTVWED
ncbi:MAG: DUF2771 domain-containing protein [Mycobacterium sp.]